MSNNFETGRDYFSSTVDEYCRINDYQETDILFNLGRIAHGQEISRDVINVYGRKRYLITEGSSIEAESQIAGSKVRSSLLKRVPPSPEYFANLDIYELAPGARSLYKLLHNTKSKPPIYSPVYMQRLAYRAGGLMRKLYDIDENCFGLRARSIIIAHNDDNISDDIVYKLTPPLFFEQSALPATAEIILELEKGNYAEFIGRALVDGFEGSYDEFNRIR